MAEKGGSRRKSVLTPQNSGSVYYAYLKSSQPLTIDTVSVHSREVNMTRQSVIL